MSNDEHRALVSMAIAGEDWLCARAGGDPHSAEAATQRIAQHLREFRCAERRRRRDEKRGRAVLASPPL